MNQGIGMDELQRAGGTEKARLLPAKKSSGFETKNGPQAFAARKDRMPHGAMDGNWKLVLQGQKVVQGFVHLRPNKIEMLANGTGCKGTQISWILVREEDCRSTPQATDANPFPYFVFSFSTGKGSASILLLSRFLRISTRPSASASCFSQAAESCIPSAYSGSAFSSGRSMASN